MDKYNTWNPSTNMPDFFRIIKMSTESGAFKILFEDADLNEKTIFSLNFHNCLAYRFVQESGRLKTLANSTLGPLNVTTKSDFISWFKEEGLGVYDDWALFHFIICCEDGIIDVISTNEPLFEID